MKDKKKKKGRQHKKYDNVAVADSVQNPMTGIGTQNDPITQAEPTLDNRLTLYEIDVLFSTSAIVQRGVSEIVEDAIKGGWWVDHQDAHTWYSSKVDEEDPTVFSHIELTNLISKAAISARRTGAGGLVIVPSEGDISRPLVAGAGVLNILPFDRWNIQVLEVEDDISAKGRWGEGRLFNLTWSKSGLSTEPLRVHRDHIVLFPGAPVPEFMSSANEGFDDSVVQGCWDAIRNFMDANNAMAGMPRKFETSVLSIAGLASTELNAEQHRLLVERMQIASQTLSQLNMMIVDADSGESFNRQFSAVNGFDVLWDRLAFMLAASFAMPMTKLFGTSPGGLSTDDASGRASWRARVGAWQTDYLTPALNQLYARLTGSKPKTIEYKSSEVLTPEEKTRVEESKSRAFVAYKTGGILAASEIRAQMKQDGVLSPNNFDDKAFEEELEEKKQADKPEPPPAVNGAAQPNVPANPANEEGSAAPTNEVNL